MTNSIYTSQTGRDVLLACYDRALQELPVSYDEQIVKTRHGRTHVLLAGPKDAPPVFIFHGGNATNPMTLAWYTSLADDYRLIAPDTIGHPGYSAETRLDPNGLEYGEWVVDLLEAYSAESAPMIGTSYGAGIIMRAAVLAPDRIDCAGLVVPAGFGTGPLRSMLPIGLASVLYRYVPNDRILDYITAALVSDAESNDLARATISASLRYVKLERTMPESTAEELRNFSAPVSLFFAEEDPFFPPEVINSRAQHRLRSISHVGLLADETHIISQEARDIVADHLRDFLSNYA